MPSNQSANVWLGRFSSHLMQLRPDLHLRAAVQRGVAVYTRIDAMEPEEAAYLTSRLLPSVLPETAHASSVTASPAPAAKVLGASLTLVRARPTADQATAAA
jgi:hypothetical protein